MASRAADGLCRRGHASQPLRLDSALVDRRKRRGCPRCAREAPLAAGRARAALPNVRHKRPPRCFSTPFIVRPAEVGKHTCSAAERPSACVRVASDREACAMWAELSECVRSRVVVCASSECTWAEPSRVSSESACRVVAHVVQCVRRCTAAVARFYYTFNPDVATHSC